MIASWQRGVSAGVAAGFRRRGTAVVEDAPSPCGRGWGEGAGAPGVIFPPNLPHKGGGAVLAALSLTLPLPAPPEFGRNAKGSGLRNRHVSWVGPHGKPPQGTRSDR